MEKYLSFSFVNKKHDITLKYILISSTAPICMNINEISITFLLRVHILNRIQLYHIHILLGKTYLIY